MSRWVGLAAAGVVGSLAFAPVQWWPMMLVSLVVAIASFSGRWSTALLQGWVYGLGFFLPLLHWSGTYVGSIPWLALAAVQAALLAPVAIAIAWAKRRSATPHRVLICIPAIWIAVEAVRSRFPWGGFGWGRVAFSQVDAPYALTVALGGAPLLSFLTVLVATAVAVRQWRSLAVVTAGLAILTITSNLTLPAASDNPLRVAVVQGNVPRLGLDFNAQRQAVLNNHIEATDMVDPASVDLILWPENASDIDPLDDPAVRSRLDRLSQTKQAPILLGAVLRDKGDLLNAALLWTPEGAGTQYVKRRLAPFGEFMPLRTLAEAVVPEARRVVDFRPGDEAVLFEVDRKRVGTMICFEVLYDDLARELVTAGASVLVAQTNSATFGTSPESYQQLQMTRLRAMEHHRAIASASTSGISALIDQRGRVLAQSEFFTQQVLTGTLSAVSGRTLSARLNGWPEAILITLPFMAFIWRRR